MKDFREVESVEVLLSRLNLNLKLPLLHSIYFMTLYHFKIKNFVLRLEFKILILKKRNKLLHLNYFIYPVLINFNNLVSFNDC